MLFHLALAAASAFAGLRLDAEPPPGWRRPAAGSAPASAVVALKGPETSSFLVTPLPRVELENRGVVRTLLLDTIAAINRRTGAGLSAASPVQVATFDNGITAYYMRVDGKGRPRAVVCVLEVGGEGFLGTLTSAIPETMLPSLVGGIRVSGAPERAIPAGRAVSRDRQLAFDQGPALASRPLLEREKAMGFVLALRGLGSELMILKVLDDAVPVEQQPQAVRATVAAVKGVDAERVTEPAIAATPAGPQLFYASAPLREPSGAAEFAAGYLPWGYWGYSLLAKGPRARELMTSAAAALELGPSALPKIVAKTPRAGSPARRGAGRAFLALAACGAVALVVALLLGRRRAVAT